jgi:chromosomal replication initiator protein
MEKQELWKNALSEIELQISKPNFITWFRNSELVDKKDGVALVSLPNNFAKNWVENKYQKLILGALRNLDETTKKIEFVVNGNKLKEVIKEAARKEAEETAGQLTFTELKIDSETNLNPKYNLNSFVVGKSNELAYAAATAIIDDIGKKYNPLFFYGGVGVGKTHLIQSMGNEIKKKYKDIKVKYVTSEKFTNEVVWAMKNKRMETIKDKYRLIDVLIIDDIQFIGGKPRTEEEFFHTFNALYQNNKQIIISSDKPPRFIPTLEERLRSRFEGGMTVDIGYPDFELKLAVIKAKLEEKSCNLKEEVVSLIANKVQKNLRELDGILNKIIFYKNAKGIEIETKVAEQIISETIQEPTFNIGPNQVIKAVADIFEVSANDLIGRSRKKELVSPRQITMYLLRDMLSLSYPFIGEKIGKRDHTTAIYAFEKISQDMNRSPELNQKILMIKDTLGK